MHPSDDPAPPPSSSSSAWARWTASPSLHPTRAWALAAVAASIAIYAVTLGHGFVYDDLPVIVENRLIRSLAQLPALVRSTEWMGSGVRVATYRPLTDVTYALNHALTGLSPWSYHAVNVLLHALASALLLLVGLRLGLGRAAAGAAALLFAVHPIHVESVANVVGRKDVLSAVFALAAVLLHARALRRGGASLAWPVLAFAASMLSKESGVVAVGLVALHDLVVARQEGGSVPGRRRAVLYAGYAFALAGYVLVYRAVTAGVVRIVSIVDNPTAHAGAAERVMTAVAVIGKGLALQLVPVGQSPDWSYRAIPLVTSPADPRFLAASASLAAWAAAGLALRRRAPVILIAFAWYLGTLFPVSNIPFAIGTIFGDRLLYLPSAGLALAAGAGLVALAEGIPRVPLRAAALAIVALALCAATVSYAHAWGDELRLARLAAARAPASSRAHAMLASILLERGDAPAALAAADRAVSLDPWYGDAHLVRADVLAALGRAGEEAQSRRAGLANAIADADPQLRAAFESSPGDADSLYAIGVRARDKGRLEDAAVLWDRAIAADPGHARALAALAEYHLGHGDFDLALGLAARAAQAEWDLPRAWYVLGFVYRARGDAPRSRAAFGRFVEVAGPEYAREAETVRRALADERREPGRSGGGGTRGRRRRACRRTGSAGCRSPGRSSSPRRARPGSPRTRSGRSRPSW